MLKVIEVVEVHTNGTQTVVIEETCNRCYGKGVFSHMAHVEGGKCFKCEGTGVTPTKIKIDSTTVYKIVNPTTEIKTLEKQPSRQQVENEAVRKALTSHKEEKRRKFEENERKYQEYLELGKELEENPVYFTWDD